MAAVIGIFEECYKKKLPLPVVLPGSQTRSFTHVEDTVKVCFEAWKKNKNSHYSISSKNLIQLIKLQIFFQKGKNIFQKEEERDLSQQLLKKLETKKSLIELEKLN